MKLLRLQATNFMQYKDLDIDFTSQGLCLVQGEITDSGFATSNTAGKTTAFVHAPLWCLFGETLNGLKADDVINDVENKKCSVTLVIENKDTKYFIQRNRKHDLAKNNLQLAMYEDYPEHSTYLTKSSMAETQAEINRLFDLDWNIFTNTIVFGQGNIKRFSELTDKERKELLDKILSLDVLQQWQAKTKETIKNFNTQMSNINRTINDNELSYKNITNKLANIDNSTENYDKTKKEKIKNIQNEITELQAKLNAQNNSEIEKQALLLEKIKVRLNKTLGSGDAYINVLDKIHKIDIEIKKEEYSIAALNRDIKIIKNKIDNIENDGRDNCDSCGQTITKESTEHFKETYITQLSTENMLLVQHVHAKEAFIFEKQTAEKEKTKIQETLSSRKEYEEYKNSIEKNIALHEANKNAQDHIRATIEQKLESINKIQDEEAPYLKMKKEYAEELSIIKLTIANCEVAKDGLLKEIEYYKFWETGFSNTGIKSFLLDSIVPFLTEKANYYLDFLTNSEIKILFDTTTVNKSNDKEVDKLSIKLYKNGKEYGFEKTSGGEKKRIDICISLALQSLLTSKSNCVNVGIFDEIFDSLDDVGIDCIMKLLQEEIKHKDSIFVISHNDNLKEKFNNIITVKKNNGVSIIE